MDISRLQQMCPPHANPGAATTIMMGMTVAHISKTKRLHTEETRMYRTYHNVDQAFQKLIIDAFEDPILNVLSDEIIGYDNCTSLQFFSHLWTYYATIAPTELTQNYKRVNTPYDHNQPIETLFQQFQDARAFAVAGCHPYGNAMIVNFAFTLIFNTGLSPDACSARQAGVVAKKTWMQLKRDFTSAHRSFV
jgi:hypothetical protein